MKNMKFVNEALASLVIAALFGVAAYLLTGWYIQFVAGWASPETKGFVQIVSSVTFGVIGFFLRWNVKK